jgi:hypothetical protein
VALALTAGAAQFAMGRDLSQHSGRDFQSDFAAAVSGMVSVPSQAVLVNRAGKSDRAIVQQPHAAAMRTFSIQPGHLIGTSVLVRIPAGSGEMSEQAQDVLPQQPAKPRATAPKPTTACELAVSVLVAGARHLAPGRCLT